MKIKLYHVNLKSNNVKIKTYNINTKYTTKIKIHIT